MQPYLLAFCEQKAEGLTRSVLTAVARIGPNQTLFATCKHAVTQFERLFLVNESGTTLQDRWGLIPTSTPDLDLAFLFIRHDVPRERIKLNESPITKETELSHGRNRYMESKTPSPFVTHKAIARPSRFRASLAWSPTDGDVMFDWLKNEAEVAKARNEGAVALYRVLEMESWSGVSGSALWDKVGSIRGMVCGGDDASNRQEDGIPRLIYIPSKTIAEQVKFVTKHPEFRRRMLTMK